MRIFLRDSDTGAFYQHPGNWVSDPDDATAFDTQNRAIEMRVQLPKPNLEMLVLDQKGRPVMGVRLWEGDHFPETDTRDCLRNVESTVRRDSPS